MSQPDPLYDPLDQADVIVTRLLSNLTKLAESLNAFRDEVEKAAKELSQI